MAPIELIKDMSSPKEVVAQTEAHVASVEVGVVQSLHQTGL